MTLIGRLFGWKKGSPEEDEPAPDGVLDEDRESESLTPEDDEEPEEDIEEKPFYFNEWPEQKPKIPTVAAEKIQREQDRKRNRPVAFLELARDDGAADKIFEGLHMHYIECLLAGRLDVWARAAHAAIDLLASPATEIHKRAA